MISISSAVNAFFPSSGVDAWAPSPSAVIRMPSSQPSRVNVTSVSFVTAACQNIADQIGHIILVCPESIRTLAKAPNHKSKLLASIINLPIYGTFIYNVGARNTALSDSAECRYLYSSILGHYTTVNIAHCLEGLTTSIAVISGKNAPETFEKAEEYCNVLPSIEHIEIAGCGLLPQRENADAFLEQIDILLSDNC